MLILDSHMTHTKYLVGTDMARETGVVMVSLPPHTTHSLWMGPFLDRLDMMH